MTAGPLVLAIDTAGASGSLALARGDSLLEETPLRSPDGFAHVLFRELEALLDRHGVSVAEIDCFAAAAGPGSFTGIRVALSAAKGLAEAAGRPVVAVSNLEALAWFGSARVRAALIDARRGEVYGRLHGQETVSAFPDWIVSVPADAEIVTANPAAFPLEGRRLTIAPPSQARAVAAIAVERFRAGLALDPAAIDANYVRRSDAELHWRE